MILSKILKLFGFKKNDENVELMKSLDDWNNRKIYPKLTIETIEAIPDDEIEQAVFDNIALINEEHYDNEFRHVSKMSKGQRAFYATWILEGEINNGGFNQFYFNSSGQFSEMAVEGLKLIGAEKFSNLVEKANRMYSEIKDDLEKYNDGTIESFSKSYDENPLNELDDEFYDLYNLESIDELRIKYIRENPNEFVTK